MKTRWYHNAKTGEIEPYEVHGDGDTNFPRGTLLAYGDYITTGLTSKADAEAWAEKWAACVTCKAARYVQPDGACQFCGAMIRPPVAAAAGAP